ncbi:MAG TPA: TusE/DsrC/DsvC family sulfur relay protein [Burkholderiaceae bacterium]|nr:TusE/DsrC/DsvC family sulfur relay protein [Burkholderiaceae bacterium]
MEYLVDGKSFLADDEGYLLEPDYSDSVCEAIAAAEGVSLDEDHWAVINYLRDQYREHGHTPNFRTLLKDVSEQISNCDSKRLYDLFPLGPAKQGVRIAGLPKPFGKGGY